MSEKLFKTVKAALSECNKLPERVKEILNSVNNSLNDLDENVSNQLWILLGEFIKDTSILEDAVDDKELLASYQCILNLVQYAINSAEDIISVYDKDEHLLKTIMMFQILYPKQFKYKFKFEIAKMCTSFWKILAASTQNRPDSLGSFNTIMTNNFVFTFNYVFDTINTTTKKVDMRALSTLLWELCKIVSTLSSDQNLMNRIVSILEKLMKNTLFLETDTGKLTVADLFTANQQLFLKFHQIVKNLLPKANKLEAEAYGEIYFIAWMNCNSSMKEVVEQQGIFDIISKSLMLQRTVNPSLRTYRNALIFLKSMQSNRKHLMFSKVITNLYAPVLWRQLRSEFKQVRCNATEILTIAYPLEKRGEGREVSSRFLIKQQDAFIDQLEDSCPQVRVAAIKGVCTCMRYFWHTFEDDRIIRCFNLFLRLMSESVFEVRRVIFYGFCQLLDESKSHSYFSNPTLLAKMKNTLNDDSEKVRRAFIHFLLKVKKIDSQNTTTNKINFAQIVNLRDTAKALSHDDKQNGLLLAELIFDNFIGDNIPDKNVTLSRFNLFYKLNPTACRKLMLYSEKVLDFESACKLIFSFLRTLYCAIIKKESRLKIKDKENDTPAKKRKSNDNSGNTTDTSSSSCDSSTSSHEDNDHSSVCCILDCVHCLMILHRDKLIDENNSEQLKDIQDSCAKCLIKLLRFYKEGNAYFSAMSLASLIPISKLTSHVSAPSAALSTLKQLPYDIKHAEEEIDMPKVDCLVYTLCKWKRGYEILQLVNIWLDEAFKTLNLNDSQYPERNANEGKRVRFKTDVEECKPMTGVMLINSMLANLQTQDTLFNSDVNKNNIRDLILYLQRVKPAIESRISSDNVLSHLLSDELLIELFKLSMNLHILYHNHEKDSGVDEIIKYQTSILDWVINNLLAFNFHHKNESTIILASNTISVVNRTIMNCCLMTYVNNTFFHRYFAFCATLLHNFLSPRVLISMITTLGKIAKHLNYLKLVDKLEADTSLLTSCVCSIISIIDEPKCNEDRFKSIIGEPKLFRCELIILILEVQKMSMVEFQLIFMTLVETIMNQIASKIREIDEFDLNDHLTELPFGAHQLAVVIFSNAKLRTYFLSNVVEIFSSDVYKNDRILLLSAISFIYTLSFQSNKLIENYLEPVVKLLYKTLMDYDKTKTLLKNNCSAITNNTDIDQGVSILETSDFSNRIQDFEEKGRNALITTAKQLHITLS